MSYESKDKMVSHPSHYQSGKYEVIDIIDEFTKDLSGTEAICTGNAIKYILRWKKKNGRQDVEKAIWYLQHLVDYLVEQETVKEPLDIDLKNDETLYSLHQEGEKCTINNTCGKCEFFKMTFPRVNIGECTLPGNSGYEIMPSHEPCSEWRRIPEPKGGYTVRQGTKFEPGCDKCEISECKFLEDPFMNPPYNELLDMWKAQKEAIEKLMRDKKEMQDSIDILEHELHKED